MEIILNKWCITFGWSKRLNIFYKLLKKNNILDCKQTDFTRIKPTVCNFHFYLSEKPKRSYSQKMYH